LSPGSILVPANGGRAYNMPVPQYMGAHMKTTIDIADSLFADARRIAEREGITLRALVEAGLHKVIAERRRGAPAFRLRRASVKGQGLRPELQGASWDRLRELAYEERGA
jgi:hypothetical protein